MRVIPLVAEARRPHSQAPHDQVAGSTTQSLGVLFWSVFFHPHVLILIIMFQTPW